MTSKKENPLPISLTISLTIPLEDGSLVRVESPRGIRYSTDKEDKVYVEVAKEVTISIGENDRLFMLKGAVTINPALSIVGVKGYEGIQLKVGDKTITASRRATIRIFDDMEEVFINGEGITIRYKDMVLYTPKGGGHIYRSSNVSYPGDREILLRGRQFQGIVDGQPLLVRCRYIDGFYQEACIGTTRGGELELITGVGSGVEYTRS